MKVVILGCGRVGSSLAERLAASGHQVTVVEQDREAFRRLSPDFPGTQIVGVGIDEDVLRRAGIEHADAFVSAAPDDNVNIMAAQVAKEVFHVPRVIARVFDPQRQEIYQSLGLDTVSSTALAVEYLQKALMVRGTA
jgi:trk system potassium uptake protein TrkA